MEKGRKDRRRFLFLVPVGLFVFVYTFYPFERQFLHSFFNHRPLASLALVGWGPAPALRGLRSLLAPSTLHSDFGQIESFSGFQ